MVPNVYHTNNKNWMNNPNLSKWIFFCRLCKNFNVLVHVSTCLLSSRHSQISQIFKWAIFYCFFDSFWYLFLLYSFVDLLLFGKWNRKSCGISITGTRNLCNVFDSYEFFLTLNKFYFWDRIFYFIFLVWFEVCAGDSVTISFVICSVVPALISLCRFEWYFQLSTHEKKNKK